MKKSLGIFFASLVIIGGMSIASSAQTRKPLHNINKRQQNQERRVYNGVRNGSLTPKEAARIERGEERIDRQEAHYRASGNGFNRRERVKLERSLNRESRLIHRQKHDKQTYPKP